MTQRKSTRPGLYANIQAKRERIAHGSGERMRKPGDAGAPSARDFRDAAKTAKPSGRSSNAARAQAVARKKAA